MSNILECRSLSFNYGDGNSKTSVLKNLDFRVKTEERIAIIGQSGCGKSTLLNLLAGLDMPSQGEVLIDNKNISNMKERQRTERRPTSRPDTPERSSTVPVRNRTRT